MKKSLQLDDEAPSALTIAAAEPVLKPLFGATAPKVTKLTKDGNAISFEVDHLPDTFKPNGKILSEVCSNEQGSSGERRQHWIVRAGGRLVRLAAFRDEAKNWLRVFGAIYVGTDEDKALEQAMAAARRF